MRNQIVILAAGKGTRIGGSVPKVLVMLKNKPLILYLLEEIEKINQLAKPVIVVGHKFQEVRDVLGESYLYAIQQEQLGTADAVKAALPKVKAENILVLYGDMPFLKASSLKKLMQLHHKNGAPVRCADFVGGRFACPGEITLALVVLQAAHGQLVGPPITGSTAPEM